MDSYYVFRDDTFKATYLPYTEAKKVFEEAEARRKASPDTEARRFPDSLLPAIGKVQGAQTRIDRKVAAMRVIEALRLHAAANGGRLPDKLSDIKLVPIPNDPGTEKPFDYQRDGDTATLMSRIPGEPLIWFGYHYFVRGGFLEGRAGFVACKIRAHYIAEVRRKVRALKKNEAAGG